MKSSASHAGTTLTASGNTYSTIKRKVDDRIKLLLETSAQLKHRSLFLLVGDRAREQVVNLHIMVSRAMHTAKVNVLWCVKSKVEFGSTTGKKMEKKGRLEIKAGMSTEFTKESFQTFLSQTNIRFCQYKETHKILGQTFSMAVLQDFEAITPNILARTLETVAGGGVIILMLKDLRSLKQLHTLVMDVHARYRTENLHDVCPRFNERFLLSLAECENVLCVDDDLTVLSFTQKMRQMVEIKQKLMASQSEKLRIEGRLQHEAALSDLKSKLKDNADVGPLASMCTTMDQAKTVLSLMQAITEKTLQCTCAITAGRGRGKSAAIGMAVAGAIVQGYSNIFVTAPSPENVATLFEFAVKGLVEMGYKERSEFEAMQSTNPDFAKCVIRINVFREHRQTIQYIAAQDSSRFAQAELLVIDEAAAIPLPVVQKLLGPYLIFIASTISGYEGTGRSLSMKLIADMKKHVAVSPVDGGANTASTASGGGRTLREIQLSEPIRYGPNDPIESWLNKLLCLDVTEKAFPIQTAPHPSSCELYYVNRDALFSFHHKAESLLERLMALLVSAHYKNQPNDLQLMSDAPGHHLFVLCGPISEETKKQNSNKELPEIFCVIHCCEEGKISSESLTSNISRGTRPSGDLIPYTLAQHFLEKGFAKLAGIRVVRIATNPDFQRGGYGTRALQLLVDYYAGNIAMTAANKASNGEEEVEGGEGEGNEDLFEVGSTSTAGGVVIRPKKNIPVLLLPVMDRAFEPVDYVGVSYGVTTELFNFWKKCNFHALYIRQVPNELTGEHSCVMVNPLEHFDVGPLKREFAKRFIALLPFSFRHLPTELALSIVLDIPTHSPQLLAELLHEDPRTGVTLVDGVAQATFPDILLSFSHSDLQRLQLASSNYVENSVVLDLIPELARIYFSKRIFRCPEGGGEGVVLSHAQAAVLLSLGLQCIPFEEMGQLPTFLGVQQQQLRAFFSKAVARMYQHFMKLQEIEKENRGRRKETEEGGGKVGGKRKREGHGEEERESELGGKMVETRVDASGNVVGMTWKRQEVDVNTPKRDSTLYRDARLTTTGDGASSHKRPQGSSVKRRKK